MLFDLSPASLLLGIVVSPYVKYIFKLLIIIGVLTLFYLVFGSFYYGNKSPRITYGYQALSSTESLTTAFLLRSKRSKENLLKINTKRKDLNPLDETIKQGLSKLFTDTILGPMTANLAKALKTNQAGLESSLSEIIDPKITTLSIFIAGLLMFLIDIELISDPARHAFAKLFLEKVLNTILRHIQVFTIGQHHYSFTKRSDDLSSVSIHRHLLPNRLIISTRSTKAKIRGENRPIPTLIP
jgi:hypothetical protein